MVCSALFANNEQMKRHEKESQKHKDNVERLKFA